MTHHHLKVGDTAPEFTLNNQDNQAVNPMSLTGKRILLSFHPLAWTSICEIQMRTLEVKHTVFKELEVMAYGISVDSLKCKQAWADAMGIKETNLLADFWPHGGVAREYGLFLEDMGISGRANVLIAPDRTIEWIKEYDIHQVPDIEAIIAFVNEQKE
ncbi:MAG: redoxin domain-containing protein [Thermodesulfobacteriota bacterium]|nr:redoxin domain-containing protein [Thermodesulfobacteriota bacterium]